MKSLVLGALVLSTGVTALVARDGTCCFGLTASGPAANGTVDQLSDGQTRVGGTDLAAGTFCIDTNGGITDGQGRGCIITVETTQFQCDDALTIPTLGFSVSSNGVLAHNGSTSFYICETGGNGENIYISTGPDVTECTPTTLTADNCKNAATSCAVSSSAQAETSSAPAVASSSPVASSAVEATSSPKAASSAVVLSSQATSTSSAPVAPSSAVAATQTVASATSTASSVATSSVAVASSSTPSSSVPTSIATSTVQTTSESALPTTSTESVNTDTSSAATQTSTQSTTASSSCATAVNTAATYQYPHLIVPVSSSSPSTAYGTSYYGYVNTTFSTIFNFDIPSSYSGKTCSLVFLFPLQSELETSSYTFSGNGEIDFKQLSSVATEATTYDSVPSTETDFGTTTIAEGNSYIISQFGCSSLAGEAVSYEMAEAGTTDLEFFEDYNPSPLGLYVTAC